VVLPMTSVRQRHLIFEAIDNLYANGSTNAGEGLRLGYSMARQNFDEEKTNRIIMCSDGVANTGTTDPDELLRKIKDFADMGITLTTVGVGMGNYNDILLEKLGDKGNGHYAYIDDLEEASRVFIENLTGNLEVIARDVKIQVDFDPETVESYRLLGFENRDVADSKFRDDREDGGEIGAGHEVTALYEIKLNRRFDFSGNLLGRIFIRFKDAKGREVSEINRPIVWKDINQRFYATSTSFRLAAAAAEFAEILKGTYWSRGSSLQAVYNLAQDVYEERPDEEVREFLSLINRAAQLRGTRAER
jgi:Ca-activated chloride channel family protein